MVITNDICLLLRGAKERSTDLRWEGNVDGAAAAETLELWPLLLVLGGTFVSRKPGGINQKSGQPFS